MWSIVEICERVFAGLLLVLAAPFLLLLAVLVWLKLGSPVLFRQERTGFRGRTFTMLKFRSMTDAVTDTGHLKPDAERLTRFGKLLRKTSLDELPELVNVARGEMSFVGPRPLLPEYLERYTPEQARRHDVKPGVTGWAQVMGRNELPWEERLALDVWYVDNRSLGLNCRILVMTILTVLRCAGTNAPSHATMPPFMGRTGREEDGHE